MHISLPVLIVLGILALVIILALAAYNYFDHSEDHQHSETRVVVIKRSNQERSEGPWKPISHLAYLKAEIDANRQLSDDYIYSLEYR